jgi:hypothetical protein
MASHYLLDKHLAMWLLRFAVDLLGVDRSSTLDHSFPLLFFSIIISGGPFKWANARAAYSFSGWDIGWTGRGFSGHFVEEA